MQQVADSILAFLHTEHGDSPAVQRLSRRLDAIDASVPNDPRPPTHADALDASLQAMTSSGTATLANIGATIQAASSELSWRIDDGLYYEGDAEISEGYRHGNMHAPLIEGDDFAMGLFLLLPEVDYLDHRHAAPEFYLNLTGPTQWRFEHGPWQEQPAGSVLWNEAHAVHATRTGPDPWLSFWAWMKDIDHFCEVVSSPKGAII